MNSFVNINMIIFALFNFAEIFLKANCLIANYIKSTNPDLDHIESLKNTTDKLIIITALKIFPEKLFVLKV